MIPVFITLLSFLIMEFVAWFSHKYIMHGLLWSWHKDHHQKEPGFFEKNDRFFLVFAIPSATSFMLGATQPQLYNLIFVGLGILLYGIAYFFVHDVFIHQRFKWFRRADNRYLRAIRKAHKIHHKNRYKEEGKFFGMLLIPYTFFKSIK